MQPFLNYTINQPIAKIRILCIIRILGIFCNLRIEGGMFSVSATEFVKNFGRFSLEAQREPVAVTNHGRVAGYFISSHEYEALLQLKAPPVTQTRMPAFKTASEELFRAIVSSPPKE